MALPGADDNVRNLPSADPVSKYLTDMMSAAQMASVFAELVAELKELVQALVIATPQPVSVHPNFSPEINMPPMQQAPAANVIIHPQEIYPPDVQVHVPPLELPEITITPNLQLPPARWIRRYVHRDRQGLVDYMDEGPIDVPHPEGRTA